MPTNAETEAAAPPLAGLRVVEMGHSVAAPYAGLLLAELGADVVKVERVGHGDPARGWGPPDFAGDATVFHALNRGKRSVAVDLRDPKARAGLRALVLDADVLIQNLKPGQAEELGFGAAELRQENPRLIHASIGAFGRTGPLADRPGYDPLMQAFSGLMGVTGEEGRPPVRVGTSIVDMGAGMWLVIGIQAALLRRDREGVGGAIDTSLLETALGWMNHFVTAQSVTGEEPRREGSGVTMIVPYQVFECADGGLVVAAGNEGLFRKLAVIVGRPDLPADPRFATNSARIAHRAVLVPELAAIFRTGTRAAWEAEMIAVGFPCAPVQTVAEAVAHPQVRALGMLRDGPMRFVDLPLSFDGVRPGSGATAAPALGADNFLLDGRIAAND